jgi:tetratricopeptide (TPR) repeat protein
LVLLVACLWALPTPAYDQIAQHVQRGDAAQAEGRFALAIREYQQALTRLPTSALLLDRLITSALSANRTDAALIYLNHLATLTGWTPALHRRAAAIYAVQGNATAVRAHREASLRDVPEDREAFRALIAAAMAQREWEAALGYLQRWLLIAPQDEWALYQAGLLLAPRDFATTQRYLTQAGADPLYRQGVGAVQRVFAEFPSDDPATLALRLGLALINVGEWSAAEHALTVSLASRPDHPAALAFLGLARDEQGADGWALIERALALAPDDPQVLYVSAIHWRSQGDAARALDILNRLGTQNPTNAAVAAEIGTLHRTLGDIVKALEWYKLAVGLAPDEVRFAVLLATFYADESVNLSEEGALVLGKLAEKFPDQPDIVICHGWALHHAGKPAEAKAQLERGLTLNSTSSRGRYLYGLFLDARGDRDGAIQSLLYVYQNATEPRYRDLTIRALTRMGYKPDPAALTGSTP